MSLSLEDKHPFDRGVQAIIATVYSMTALFAIVGNLTVIIILIFGNRSRSDLTTFLVNLAVSDLGMALFCIPFTFTQAMLGDWVFGEFMCTFVLFTQVLMVSVSIFTNMTIGIDRYLAVKYPLRRRLSKRKAGVVLSIVWVVSFALASVQFAVARLSENFTEHKDCNEIWPDSSYRLGYTVFMFLSAYFLPLGALSVSYYCIGKSLWEYTTPGNPDEVRDQLQLESKRRVIKMLVAVVVVFALCWLPLHLWALILDAKPDLLLLVKTETHERVYYGVFFTCHWLAMSNSFSNPIIYGFLNENFRADLKLLCRRCKRGGSLRSQSSYRRDRGTRYHTTSMRSSTISRGSSVQRDRNNSWRQEHSRHLGGGQEIELRGDERKSNMMVQTGYLLHSQTDEILQVNEEAL
ncbi:neuropeptide Y receptor type 5-like [Lingula anatina]|uniref:Neuropeptide Y receptor type 5-like n=1 Tax=Lingula anatina TaxID=7574 RepID=A0A1S3H6K0_LINAN|nr:neuropeptide Y receptor type 5-like [Lingula anatina]|eukprot:XP_013381106.2 neuropeptide Y receptor type 5-like [Lingula anatina]